MPQALADDQERRSLSRLPAPLRASQIVDAEIRDLRALEQFLPAA
jgi:hypothetical protein